MWKGQIVRDTVGNGVILKVENININALENINGYCDVVNSEGNIKHIRLSSSHRLHGRD